MRLLGEQGPELRLVLGRELGAALLERLRCSVDGRDGRTKLMRRQRGELALQLVESPELAVGDRPFEKGGDERAEGGQQVDLGPVEREGLAALVAGHEPEAAPLAEER